MGKEGVRMIGKLWGKALCSLAGAAVLALGVSATTLASPDDEFVTQDDLKALKGEIKTLRDELKSIKFAKPAAGSDVTGNVYSSLSRKIKIGGQVRLRFESWYTNDFDGGDVDGSRSDSGPSEHVEKTSLRTRLNVDADINDYLRAFVELQDSRVFGEEGSTVSDGEQVDMLQGYTEIKSLSPVAPALSNVSVLLGRWRLLYGKQRIIGPLDWSNVGRAWDGARVRWSGKDGTWVDGFITQIKEGFAGKTSDKDEIFWGIYGHCTQLKGHVIEPYFLGRNSTFGGTFFKIPGTTLDTENRYTAGLRVAGKPSAIPGFDYDLEGNLQFGNVTVSGSGFDIEDAYSAHASAGYTFKDVAWTPRIGGQFNYASGDDDAGDDETNTFDQIYPTGHAHLGYIDYVGRQNIFDYVLNLSCKPSKKLTLKFDFHYFELDEEEDDAWYGVGGTFTNGWSGVGKKPDEELGQEIDITAKYAMFKNFIVVFGYSHFFAGDFITDKDVSLEKSMGDSDADWFYLMTILNF